VSKGFEASGDIPALLYRACGEQPLPMDGRWPELDAGYEALNGRHLYMHWLVLAYGGVIRSWNDS
jgi:hypothetical protein